MNSNMPGEGTPSKTWSIAKHAQALQALCQAVESMPGHSPSALLGDAHEIAKVRFGFEGSIDDAVLVLQQTPGIRLEMNEQPERIRVFLVDQC